MIAALAPSLVALAVLSIASVGHIDALPSDLRSQHGEFGTGQFCHSIPVQT
jgi:hypothetical protein